MEKYAKRLQKIVEELGRRNYYLKKEERVLRGLVRDYQGRNNFLERFLLLVFILGQLVVRLYLLGFFDRNDIYITIF